MRAPLALLGVAALAQTTAASAAPSGPKTYAELPLASVPAPPVKPVRWVGGHERSPGFHIVRVPTDGGPTGVEVFGSAEDRKALQSGQNENVESCFADVEHANDPGWSLGESRMMVWGGDGDTTKAVRSEKLVESEDHATATLELVDAWVDSRSGGAKLIAKTTVPMVLVGSALGEVRVYAARDESAATKDVHVVVKREGPRLLSGFPFQVDRTNTILHGQCSHAHVVLRGKKVTGDVAIVKTTIRLPDLKESDAKAKDDELPSVTTEARTRELEVQLGASQTSTDKVPVFSVSFGWSGREQTADVALNGTIRSRGKRFKK